MKRIGLFITILGVSVAVAASFMIVGGINPSKPYQVSSTATTHNNLFATTLQETSFHQKQQMMDNPNIEIDMNINPARKCSVCIGVRTFFVPFLIVPIGVWRKWYCSDLVLLFDDDETAILVPCTFPLFIVLSVSDLKPTMFETFFS